MKPAAPLERKSRWGPERQTSNMRNLLQTFENAVRANARNIAKRFAQRRSDRGAARGVGRSKDRRRVL
jgi:hypothetical protein